MRTRLLALTLVFTLLGCTEVTFGGPEGPIPDAEVRALFIGNSLTASNNLPAMVEAIAEAGGHSFAYRSVIRGGFALEDHYHAGVEDDIREAEADFVVMQQGPSSLPQNQTHLRQWTEALAPSIEEAGGVPALYMVWPDASRMFAYDAVRDAYRNAAQAVDGLFIPAGMAWLEVWEADPEAELYGPDDFHPTSDGTFVAALTVYAVLFDEDPRDLPPLSLAGVTAEEAALYAEAVYEAIQGGAAEAAAGRAAGEG